MLAFVCSVASGYVIWSQMTGYFIEVAKGSSADSTIITSPKDHYGLDYYTDHLWLISLQLYSSLIGILSLTLWYIYNVLPINKKNP